MGSLEEGPHGTGFTNMRLKCKHGGRGSTFGLAGNNKGDQWEG